MILLLISLAFAATKTYYVLPHPSENRNYVARLAFEPDNMICLAPKDPSGEQVVYVDDLDIDLVAKSCSFNPAKRAARLAAEQTEKDAIDQEIALMKAAYQRVNAVDFDNATTAELKAALKDMWLVQKGTVKHLKANAAQKNNR